MATRSLPLDYDIVVYSGTSYKREFRWLPDGVNPMDFTGWSASMLVGQPLNPADVQLSSEPGGGIELTTTGRIVVVMTPTQTALLNLNVSKSVAFYNLDLTEPSGFIRRFLRGRVSVVVDVKPQT